MAKRRFTEKDRAYLERANHERLREDWLELTVGQRIEARGEHPGP